MLKVLHLRNHRKDRKDLRNGTRREAMVDAGIAGRVFLKAPPILVMIGHDRHVYTFKVSLREPRCEKGKTEGSAARTGCDRGRRGTKGAR